ncbi:MAG: choice-of-anchor D domain-containing protein [Acidobacteria bacterium]|nr:choice-of-anchor D domain-containing protein [Acidobacteriota bacterium]
MTLTTSMTKRLSGLALLLAGVAGAQIVPTPAPFNIRVQIGNTVQNLTDFSTLAINADFINQPVTANIAITYRGTASASISAFELTGSTDFVITSQPDAFPVTMSGASVVNLQIRFTPSSGQRANGRFAMNYTERGVNGVFSTTLQGTAPDFVFSYIPQSGNPQPATSGDTINFPLTNIDATSTVAIVASNRGSGPGVVNSIGITGAVFQLSGASFGQTTVDAGRDLRFGVQFTPKVLDPQTGTVTVELVNRRFTLNLAGAGSGPQFAYEAILGTTITPIFPGQPLAVPDTQVGEKSSITIRARNIGNADGRITALGVSGTGFSLGDAPFVPANLNQGASITFTVVFAPTVPGSATGRVRINNDNFDLMSTGLGASLTYSYSIGNVTTTVSGNGTIVFTPTAVGRASSIRFIVTNTGTSPSAVNSVSVSGPSAPNNVFNLVQVPSLPATIQPGGTMGFDVSFAPGQVGQVAGTLRVDTQSFSLSGAATNPAPLPTYRFEGASGAQDPQAQPTVSLVLAEAYAIPLSGTLTLAFHSDVFANDAAVQFAAGGRTINFTIPANQTRAVFPNNQNTVRLQTGTVAGTITITPSFQTDGGINLTPATPPALNLTVAAGAPRLLNVQVGGKTASGFTLLVTGFATGRSVTQMDFTFTAVQGETVATQRLSVNAESNFIAWYTNNQSQAFGSLFTASIPFNLTGDVKNVTNVADTIQSVAVTIANRQGTSASRTVELR